ncbi:MAG TPA: hypothetical protein VKM93_11185 [Terriglobia bacterium]|nr:hypothetical protein [Terriglobia bacterium]
MRDRWYGDKRDIVKWGALLALARKRSIPTVLQVALYRPDRPSYKLTIDGGTEPLPVEVVRHFRNIDQIQELATTAKVTIDVHKDVFQRCPGFRGSREAFRKSYFDGVAERIEKYADPVIVFLDPDTGIAPRSYDYKHVTRLEIQTVLRAMKAGDVLVFYQHARRGDRNWLNSTKIEFSQAVGPHVPVDTVTCNEIVNDVAFFVVDEWSKWVETPAKEAKAGTQEGAAN